MRLGRRGALASMSDAAEINERPFFAGGKRLDAADQLLLRTFERGSLSIAQYRRDLPGFGITTPNPVSDTYMVVVKLSSFEPHDMWRDGRYLKRPGFRGGGLSIIDLRHTWIADLQQPFHTINFFVPQHALDGLAEDLRAPKIGRLTCPLDSEQRDDVMLHLALSLRPALERPREASRLFADQIATAMSTHLAFAYGGLRPGGELVKGGLSPVQERRVKEMLMADMRGDLSLSELAAACGLSAGHFSRAFKRTTGLPPHRWLMEQRLKRAKALLLDPSKSLADVATSCGFADQSHFTRVFSGRVGATPGVWKRLMGG